MFTTNPFAALSASIPASVIQTYVVIMILLVIGGTLFDIIHKGSAKYFFDSWRKAKSSGNREVDGGEMMSIAVKTAAVDVLASGEFCNPNRRVAHLLTMYGFLVYVITTAIMVFGYLGPDSVTPGILPFLWHLGALSVCIGGYWFWFFIRVDVAAEGQSPFRLVRADLFVLSLLASTTLALIWSMSQASGSPTSVFWLGLYLIATTVLFAGIPWSKFAHMFFKPAAALEKRMSEANGHARNLPTLTRDDPEQQKRHSMELLQDAPMDMGLGIKRETPNHY